MVASVTTNILFDEHVDEFPKTSISDEIVHLVTPTNQYIFCCGGHQAFGGYGGGHLGVDGVIAGRVLC